jgi:hypothetical protein
MNCHAFTHGDFRPLKDGVRIRLKHGGLHGSELASHRGAHHGFFRNSNLRGTRRGLSSR